VREGRAYLYRSRSAGQPGLLTSPILDSSAALHAFPIDSRVLPYPHSPLPEIGPSVYNIAVSTRIEHDPHAPSAAIELAIRRPLPDYDLEEVEASVPRDVDPMLASQGFHDLLDEARAILKNALPQAGLEMVQLTGAICSENKVHRPGLWLVVRESGAAAGAPMSAAAKGRVEHLASELHSRLQL